MNNRLYTQGEVANLFGVNKDSILDWEREGFLKLHSIHIKTKARLYLERDVEALLEHKDAGDKLYKCKRCNSTLGLSDKNPPIIIIVTSLPNNCPHPNEHRDNCFCYLCNTLLFKTVLCETCAAKKEKEQGKPLLISEQPTYPCRSIYWKNNER